jgi:hypothetical protein
LDSFNRFYAALHSPHAWRDELAAALDRHQFVIRLRCGKGYLLHDRHWLHGRTLVSQPVGRRRFRGDGREAARAVSTRPSPSG